MKKPDDELTDTSEELLPADPSQPQYVDRTTPAPAGGSVGTINVPPPANTPQSNNVSGQGLSLNTLTPAPSDGSGSGGGSADIDKVIAEYQSALGRAPTADELKSEQDNLTRYGFDTGPNGGIKAQIDARASNTPTPTPTQLRSPSAPSSSTSGSTYGADTNYIPAGTVQTNGVAADDPFGSLIGDKLSELIANNGHTNSDQVALQREQATEDMNTSRRTQLNQAQGELADRNLLSVPGIPQGSELGAMGRIESNIAPAYADANRDITIADDKQANDTLLSVLNMGNERQGMLGQIALQTLSQNTQWNEFLATYGLQRDQVMYQLQNGQISDLEGLMQLFEQYAQTSAGGHV